MEEENKATNGWQQDPKTGRKWRPVTSDELERANKIYADLNEAEQNEAESIKNDNVPGHYISQSDRGYQTRKDEIPSSKEDVEPNQEIVDSIARKLIHAYVFSLNPQLANEYWAKQSQHTQGEVSDEEFKQSEQSVIKFLNQANEDDFSPVDEVTLVQQAKKLARIEDEKVRDERIHALIDPLLEE